MIALALFVAAPTSAQTVFSPGFKSCGEWTAHKAENRSDRLMEMTWVNGYLSAYNAFGPDKTDVLHGDNLLGAFAWLDNYCAANPLDDISLATVKLIGELRKR